MTKILSSYTEYIGKINLYLEALDREVKKKTENPSLTIGGNASGGLLCEVKRGSPFYRTMAHTKMWTISLI